MESGFMNRVVLCAAVGPALLTAGLAQATVVAGQGTWETTLLGRDIGGNAVAVDSASAVFLYDKTLDVTWLRNANANGPMEWPSANTWANALTVGTFSGWRLPKILDTGAPGCDLGFAGGTDCGYNVQTKSGDPTKFEAGQTVYSEMAHLFYVTLGNKGYCPPGDATCAGSQPGWGLTNMGSFQNMEYGDHWSGTKYAPDPDLAWRFNTGGTAGSQYFELQDEALYALAVRPGDVAAVPEPKTYAMLLLGLSAVMVVVRRRPR